MEKFSDISTWVDEHSTSFLFYGWDEGIYQAQYWHQHGQWTIDEVGETSTQIFNGFNFNGR